MSDAADSNLSFTYQITADTSLVTVVSGASRSNATVEIMGGATMLWTALLTAVAPQAVLPQDIVFQGTVIQAGASFILIVPSQIQQGQVYFRGMVGSGAGPAQGIDAAIATWPLE